MLYEILIRVIYTYGIILIEEYVLIYFENQNTQVRRKLLNLYNQCMKNIANCFFGVYSYVVRKKNL